MAWLRSGSQLAARRKAAADRAVPLPAQESAAPPARGPAVPQAARQGAAPPEPAPSQVTPAPAEWRSREPVERAPVTEVAGEARPAATRAVVLPERAAEQVAVAPLVREASEPAEGAPAPVVPSAVGVAAPGERVDAAAAWEVRADVVAVRAQRAEAAAAEGGPAVQRVPASGVKSQRTRC